MRILFLFSVVVLLITNMISFFGCSLYEDDGHLVIEDAYIEGIEISISESRPAQVMVTATASHRNTCVLSLEIHQTRSGNTISLWGEMEVIEGTCGQAVTEIQKQVSIGEFTIGEYKVIAGDLEFAFHIEDDESWIIRKPIIEDIEFLLSESRPAQVSVNVEGYFCGLGLPFFETHQRQEEDTLYIQITSKVPSSIPCPLGTRDFLRHAWGIGKYEKEISIGEFMPGHYRVVVNDIEGWFFIE